MGKRPNRLLKLGGSVERFESTKDMRSEPLVQPLILSMHPTLRSGVRRSLLGSLQHSSRYHAGHSGETHQVAGSHGQLELQIDATQSAKHGLSNSAHGLAPTEMLLDSFAHHLAQAIARMARGTTVNRAAATTGIVGSDVRRNLALPARGNKVRGVVGFIRPNAAATRVGRGIEHGERRAALAEAIGMSNDGANHQAVAVLH